MPHLLQMDSASKQIQRASVSVHTTPDNLEYQYRSLQMTSLHVEPDAFSIDHSTGTPILMHNNCSVIEGELAYSILNLISRFQWQPIETVPKDGTKVLVGCFKPGAEKYGLVEVDWYRTWGSSRFSFIGFGRFNHIYYPATHWMPLPPVPEEGKAESQKPTPAQAYGQSSGARVIHKHRLRI
jgi:hypothetical protein